MKTVKGFTLLEIILVIGILSLVFFLGFNIISATQRTIARQEAKNLEQIFQSAALQARNGVNGSGWGVYVPYNETTRKTHEVIVFSGLSYLSRDQTQDIVYPFNAEISFTSFKKNPSSAGNDHEIVFSYLTGQSAATGSLSLTFFDEALNLSFSASGFPVLETL